MGSHAQSAQSICCSRSTTGAPLILHRSFLAASLAENIVFWWTSTGYRLATLVLSFSWLSGERTLQTEMGGGGALRMAAFRVILEEIKKIHATAICLVKGPLLVRAAFHRHKLCLAPPADALLTRRMGTGWGRGRRASQGQSSTQNRSSTEMLLPFYFEVKSKANAGD